MTIAHTNAVTISNAAPISFFPFSLTNNADYLAWRRQKLADYPRRAEDIIVPISEINSLTLAEIRTIQHLIKKTNIAIYQLPNDAGVSKLQIQQLGQLFGLHQLDHNLCADEESISTIRISQGRKKHYIPYTNKALSWHTDGYYNRQDLRIRSFILHCVSPAAQGGENMLLDSEIAYIHLRDENPAYIAALMQDNCMTIPPNAENGLEIRGAQTGPVFSVDTQNGQLHMRFTARSRNIQWRNDAVTGKAVDALEKILSSSPYLFRIRFQAGQGLLCNNVLHNRSDFIDDTERHQVRVMYRARYYDRIRVKEFQAN